MARTRRLRRTHPGTTAARMTPLWASLLAMTVGMIGGCAHTKSVGPGRTVQLALTEYRLLPQSISAPQGTLTILVHNHGRLTHNLVVSTHGQTVDATKPLPPGQSIRLALNLAPGNYALASTLQSDEALGLYGTLTITQ
jgi:hypothetical protein